MTILMPIIVGFIIVPGFFIFWSLATQNLVNISFLATLLSCEISINISFLLEESNIINLNWSKFMLMFITTIILTNLSLIAINKVYYRIKKES